MRKSNTDATNNKSAIPCIEVLISRSYIRNSSDNLFWTLSVYSLENQPVKKDRSLHNSEIFHFMTYDWKRTIKKLLDDHKVPYSIIQYFSADSICNDAAGGSLMLHDDEEIFLSAVRELSEHLSPAPSDFGRRFAEEEEKNAMLDERLP